MAGPYPLATLSAQITATGVVVPSYVDILESLKASAAQIFGADVYLESDSQDGQLLAILAQAQHDSNQSVVAAYNSFSPATAQGVGLSSVVKINHMQRNIATNSQVNVEIGGTAGTIISGGIVGDDQGNQWSLPASVTIPPEGVITVTATAAQPGATAAPIDTVTLIVTPTAGWQTVTNPSAATVGEPVETDADLRTRQDLTPALLSITVLEGIRAGLLALPGVLYALVYENDTNVTDSNGLPPHSISAVVRGGDATAIAQVIFDKKGPGVATYGTTSVEIVDMTGIPRSINFFVPVEIAIKVKIQLNALANYNTLIASTIKDRIAAFLNAFDVGEDLIVNRLFTPALLGGSIESETYRITTLQAAKVADAFGTSNVVVAFNERITGSAANVTIEVV